MASAKSEESSLSANGWPRRSWPVFFLYSFEAASNIDIRVEEGTTVWLVVDMALHSGDSGEGGKWVVLVESLKKGRRLHATTKRGDL